MDDRWCTRWTPSSLVPSTSSFARSGISLPQLSIINFLISWHQSFFCSVDFAFKHTYTHTHFLLGLFEVNLKEDFWQGSLSNDKQKTVSYRVRHYFAVINTLKKFTCFACYRKSHFFKSNTKKWLIHTHPFNGPLPGTTRVSCYQIGKTNLDFSEARDSEWQWHQLNHMQVCTSLQTDNHTSTPPLVFTGRMPYCRPND